MHKTFAGMVEKAKSPDGSLDLEALDRLVNSGLLAAKRAAGLDRMRLEAAIATTGQAISIYDRDRKLVYCNRQFLHLYGLPKRLGRPGTTFEAILRGRTASGSGCLRPRAGLIGLTFGTGTGTVRLAPGTWM